MASSYPYMPAAPVASADLDMTAASVAAADWNVPAVIHVTDPIRDVRGEVIPGTGRGIRDVPMSNGDVGSLVSSSYRDMRAIRSSMGAPSCRDKGEGPLVPWDINGDRVCRRSRVVMRTSAARAEQHEQPGAASNADYEPYDRAAGNKARNGCDQAGDNGRGFEGCREAAALAFIGHQAGVDCTVLFDWAWHLL